MNSDMWSKRPGAAAKIRGRLDVAVTITAFALLAAFAIPTGTETQGGGSKDPPSTACSASTTERIGGMVALVPRRPSESDSA